MSPAASIAARSFFWAARRWRSDFGLEEGVALLERLRVGLGEGGIVAAMVGDGRFADARRGGGGLGVAGRSEMGEEDCPALGGEADVAVPAALVDAAVGRGDAELAAPGAFVALGISADPALGGGGGGERFGPFGLEGGIAGAGAVEAHQAEAGGEGGVLAAFAPAQARQEGRLGRRVDEALGPARIVLLAHSRN